MSLILEDEQGPLEIDGRLLALLWRETFQMAVAYTVEYGKPGASDKEILRLTNKILQRTWGNDEWMKRYMHYMFTVARENRKEE